MSQSDYKTLMEYGFLPSNNGGVDALVELALDLRWSWSHVADELWQQLDPTLWELTRNPWIILQTVSRDLLRKKLADPDFSNKANELLRLEELAASSPRWFQQNHPNAPLTKVAYFSMEYMLSEALPIYVGGLGNVAGDQLKSANDLGVPVIAIGLLYDRGYFRQEIDKQGSQLAVFPYNDPKQLPITPLRLPNGEWLRLKLTLSGYPIWLRTWQVQVGRVTLYLLDSNDAANLPLLRGITGELYGGGPDMRIKQEYLLGIGGWKLLRALDIAPEVCHLNEGHAAFVVLERASDFMKENGVSFEEALAVTRAGNLFTTHTAVAAGFDYFSPSLMEQFLGSYAQDELRIAFKDLMALGRLNPDNPAEYFYMAYLAIRGSGAVNGVSQLHSTVSRHLFEPVFPRWPKEEIPIDFVTNGVHTPSWDSQEADEIWTNACGKDRWKGELETLTQDISTVSDDELWQLRNTSRTKLVHFIRQRFEKQALASGLPKEVVETAKHIFDTDTLTLGFARRFVPYKRPNLLLHNPERLIRLLTNPESPVQLVIAGKAPPYDEDSKALIRQWVLFIQEHNLYHHVVFLSDYDVLLTEHMIQGADVWINTPRRPWEACGTSGMKVLVNGGINLSVLDGWWAEAYTPEVGWALGHRQEHDGDPGWDAAEAEELYGLLEHQVVPEFYARNKGGIPERWIQRMRRSMSTLAPRFSANRTVREYTEKYYLPAATTYRERAANKGAAGKKIIDIKRDLSNHWNSKRFVEVKTDTIENGYFFQASVGLDGIPPDHIVLELFAEGVMGSAAVRIPMEQALAPTIQNEHCYHAAVQTARPASDFTVRIIPNYENISVPLEDNHILWQR